jgi:hypothetical protein
MARARNIQCTYGAHNVTIKRKSGISLKVGSTPWVTHPILPTATHIMHTTHEQGKDKRGFHNIHTLK